MDFLVCVITVLVSGAALAADADRMADEPRVHLSDGVVSGAMVPGSVPVWVYRGIPYAAAPVGALRWREPQPVAAWEGVRRCERFGAACPQPTPILGGPPAQQSEACLTLNVWTGAHHANEKRPVMVWIHGGGYTTGSGAQPLYDGTELARQGVVLVTINYRLGPFGFFAHPLLTAESPHRASGNYGLLDQIAALRWVQRNIAAFGGDPQCVTIFGESAGAGSVAALMTSPLARGLFHRAILQSGFAQAVPLKMGEGMGERVAVALGCANATDPLAALRAKSAQEVLAAASPAQGLFGKGNKYLPVIDGYVLPESPGRVFREGRQAAVPTLAGSNLDDGSLFVQQLDVRTVAGYRLVLRALFGARSQEAFALFPATCDEDIPRALNQLVTVGAFATNARLAAKCAARAGSRGYLYQFSRRPVSPAVWRLGCAHGLEIGYVFGTLGAGFPGAYEETDRVLSCTMSAAWVRFAATGDPNGPGLPQWPPYTPEEDQYMEFGDAPVLKAGLWRQACDLFEQATAAGRWFRE